MKYIYLIFLTAFLFTGCENKEESVVVYETPIESIQTGYDSVLAAKYGADEYGMKSYVMAFLKAGPTRELDSKKKRASFLKLSKFNFLNFDSRLRSSNFRSISYV